MLKKLVNAITAALQKAGTNPEFYNPDKYKQNNDGSYRAYEKHRNGLLFAFFKNIIRVLHVGHTSMKPKHD